VTRSCDILISMPRRLACLVLVLPLCACGPDPGEIGWLRQPLTALCTVNVTGSGIKQVETDYLAHVVACENGAADMEALKAQAVAARSFMYYKIKTNGGTICDGQSCQVYTCAAQPAQKHHDAVSATAGQVLVYSGVVICAFYVAGAKPSTSTCKALSSDPDGTNTEKYVTYNEGLSGSSLIQSTLGWVDPGNLYNRGCKSQNGANCLSLKGKTYPEILHFYYGADIQLVTATGSCVTPPPPPPADQSVVPTPDSRPPQLDQGVTPKLDHPVTGDSRQPGDRGRPPTGDGLPPLMSDGAVWPTHALQGGCQIGASPAAPSLLPMALLALLVWRRRRSRRR